MNDGTKISKNRLTEEDHLVAEGKVQAGCGHVGLWLTGDGVQGEAPPGRVQGVQGVEVEHQDAGACPELSTNICEVIYNARRRQ